MTHYEALTRLAQCRENQPGQMQVVVAVEIVDALLEPAENVVPLLQSIRGMCTDEEPYPAIDRKLSEAIDMLTVSPVPCERCTDGTTRGPNGELLRCWFCAGSGRVAA